jgi:hypothetical protein
MLRSVQRRVSVFKQTNQCSGEMHFFFTEVVSRRLASEGIQLESPLRQGEAFFVLSIALRMRALACNVCGSFDAFFLRIGRCPTYFVT